MTTPLLKPAWPPYITPSELAVMLDQAGGGGTKWTAKNVRSTLRAAGALIDLPVAEPWRIAKRKPGKGSRWATTYDLLQKHLPEIYRALVIAVPTEDLERLLANVA
jgi:hypothetical protein